jgi:hypothetical protein
VAKATAQSTSTMPGAPAPQSRHAERLARLKLLRRKAKSGERKHRRWLKNQLLMANILLAEIIDGADVISEVVVTDEMDGYGHVYRYGGVCLLVTLDSHRFAQLCEYGAEIEDAEDDHDHELTDADHGEIDEYLQPSLLPATGGDGLGWNSVAHDTEADGELVGSGCTDAPAKAIIEEARSRFEAATGSKVVAVPSRDPENGKAGAWLLLQRRGGGAK